jgi:CRISPR/Cas system CSM-associated protein Csm5 (group 7 of RAMP superfamily)
VERDLKAKKFKTKDLELAVRQALDPSLLEVDEEDQEDDDDEEEEDGGDVPEAPVKKTLTRGSKKGKAEPVKKSAKVNGTRSSQKKDIDDDEEQVIKAAKPPAKRRSRIIEDEDDNDVQEGNNHDRPSKMVSVHEGGAQEPIL